MRKELFNSLPRGGIGKMLLLAVLLLMVGVSSVWAQKDVTTQYITSPTLSSLDGWTAVNFNEPQKGKNTAGYASEAYAGWNSLEVTNYSLTQDITLPAGNYTLVCYAFFRQGEASNTNPSKSLAFLKAGDQQVAVKTLGSITAAGYANSQTEGANAFDSKMYRNTVDFTLTSQQTINIGLVGTFDLMRSWCIVGSFELIDNNTKATMDAPFNVTGYITNPGFEYRDMTGWTLSSAGAIKTQNNNPTFQVGGYYAEQWQQSGALSARSMSQTLTDLPAGYYKLTANLGGNGTYIGLNGKTVAWTADNDYTVGYNIEKGQSLTITAGKTAEGTANWIHFDNFRLFYCGDPAATLQVERAKALTIINSPFIPESAKTALQTAYDNTASPVNDDYVQAIDDIDNAIAAAKTAIAGTKVYLKNVASGKFWGAGNSWGTQASLVDEYQYARMHIQDNGKYQLESMVDNGGSHFFNGSFMDGSAIDLTVTKKNDGTYTIADADGNLFGYDGSSTVLGKSITDATNAAWQVLSESDIATAKTDLISGASGATLDAPVELTLLIDDANFGRNRRDANDVWNPVASNRTLNGGGSDGNGCAESYHSTFTISQSISNLTNGLYKVTAQGYYRQDGTTAEALPYITANNEKGILLPKTGTENSIETAGASFGEGNYKLDPIYVEVTDGTLTVGVQGTATNQWVAWDNIQLYYCGDSKAEYVASLKAKLTTDAAKSTFDAAVTSATTIDAIEEALQTTVRTQTTEGADYTATIVNPSFETGDTRGWTLTAASEDTGARKAEGNYATDNIDGSYIFNTWWKGVPITQTIENLPNGLYTVTAIVGSGDTNKDGGVYLTANNDRQLMVCSAGSGGTGQEVSITTAVTDGTLTIGAVGANDDETHSYTAEGYWWYKADNFKLEYAGAITEKNSIAELAGTTTPVIFNMTNLQVVIAGSDSIIAQEEGDQTIGVMLKGVSTTKGASSAALDKLISGKVYGTYDSDTHIFTVLDNSGNEITAADGKTTLFMRNVATAADAENIYQYTSIENVTISYSDDKVYAVAGDHQIEIDKHLNENLVLNDGDVVNSITGITFLSEDGQNSVLAPRTQDDIVPVLWSAENIVTGEDRSVNPIDLTTDDIMARMQNLKAGDVLNIQTIATNDAPTATVTAKDGRSIFVIPGTDVIEVPITADIVEEVNKYGLKIAVSGRNAQMVTVSNAVYADTENSIWLGEGTTQATLGAIHFEDVRKGDIITATGSDITLKAGETDITSGTALTEEQAAALLDGTLSMTGTISKVTFKLGDNPRDEKFEAEEGDSFDQSETVTANGMTMTYGGNNAEGAKYSFAEVYPAVNKYNTMTEGIKQLPVDDNNKAYDAEQKNLPTQGTYYVFNATKTGTLEITTDLEGVEKLVVTEDGAAMDQEDIILGTNTITFDVDSTKTYYVFATDADLKLYGFKFTPKNANAEDVAKNIKVFRDMAATSGKLMLNNAVVTYIKGDNVFVEDNTGAIDFYQTGIQFYVGQKLNGFIIGDKGTLDSLPVITRNADTDYSSIKMADSTATSKAITIAEALKYENTDRFVNLTEVKTTTDDFGFTVITDGTNSVRVEDHFNVFYELSRKINSIEGIVGVNAEGTMFLWPTSKEGVVPSEDLSDGKYVLRNVASGLYWGAGNNWGTKASLLDYSEFQTLHMQLDGTFQLESQVSNGGTDYYFNGDFMDNGSPMSLTIKPVNENDNNVLYTIADGDKYFGYDPAEETPYVISTAILGKGLAADDKNALWEIIPADAESLADATEENPMDATYMIQDPNFGRNNRYKSAWSMEASNQNLSGGANENMCAESWHSTFTLSQTLANMPKGVYQLTAQGFYRQDGTDNENLPVFYANDNTQTFPLKTGSENSMSEASASFAKGQYVSSPIFFELKDNGNITIGAKNESNTALWCIWDNFQLKYYGKDADIATVKNSVLLAQLNALREKATSMAETVDFATAKTTLNNALKATENVDKKSTEAIKTAIATLENAIKEGETFNNAKNTLAKMKELVDATNLYTQEAYNNYYGTWQAKYNDGSLTASEASALQDPTIITGWHAEVTVDDLLMSRWEENIQAWDSYHVNTWSTEGNTDGSNFCVPFVEYWVADANSLAEKTLTATVDGLGAGEYDVTAWVRVRMKNGGSAPAYGITMQANNGEAVNVADGEQIGTSQLYLKECTTKATVGTDGKLNITFNIAADNNISWLAFKNVKFTQAEAPYVAGSETELDATGDKNTTIEGKSYTIDGIYCAGKGSSKAGAMTSKGFKLRTANGSDPKESVVINVKEGFTITDLTLNAISNYAQKEGVDADKPNVSITKVEVDGQEVTFTGGGFPAKGSADCGTMSISGIKATQTIKLYFDNSNSAGSQLNIAYIVNYLEKGATSIEAVETKVPAYETGAVYNLKGQKVAGSLQGLKKGIYIMNGKKISVK